MSELNAVQLQERGALSTKLPTTLDGADILPEKPTVTAHVPAGLGLQQPLPLQGEVVADKSYKRRREFLAHVQERDRPRIRVAGGCQVEQQVARGWSEALGGLAR